MLSHPVHFRVVFPEQMNRIHVIIRLVLLAAIGAAGCSSLYWLLFLGLPALAALFIVQKGAPRYLEEDAPRVVRVLRWLAGAYAYLWLLTDAPPTGEASGQVELDVEPTGEPSAASALLRLLYSLPALVVLAVLSLVASLFWVAGALFIVVTRRVPIPIADFLAAVLRYQFRLIAYHLSLVDRYPSFEEADVPHLSGPKAA